MERYQGVYDRNFTLYRHRIDRFGTQKAPQHVTLFSVAKQAAMGKNGLRIQERCLAYRNLMLSHK